jgi:hypothetical protein
MIYSSLFKQRIKNLCNKDILIQKRKINVNINQNKQLNSLNNKYKKQR